MIWKMSICGGGVRVLNLIFRFVRFGCCRGSLRYNVFGREVFGFFRLFKVCIYDLDYNEG